MVASVTNLGRSGLSVAGIVCSYLDESVQYGRPGFDLCSCLGWHVDHLDRLPQKCWRTYFVPTGVRRVFVCLPRLGYRYPLERVSYVINQNSFV